MSDIGLCDGLWATDWGEDCSLLEVDVVALVQAEKLIERTVAALPSSSRVKDFFMNRFLQRMIFMVPLSRLTKKN